MLVAPALQAGTWYIDPDGTGDAPTIQAGLDSAAAGDTVSVACGTYNEAGIMMKSGVMLLSETGQPGCAVIDAEWVDTVLDCHDCDSTTTIRGFTITHGAPGPPVVPPGYGGGMYSDFSFQRVENCRFVDNAAGGGAGVCIWYGSPKFVNCVFSENDGGSGGGIFMTASEAVIEGCVFDANTAGYGGGIFCSESSPLVSSCTMYANRASQTGSGMYCLGNCDATVEKSIISFSQLGRAVYCEYEGEYPTFICCDIYGNTGGDWIGCIADQIGVDGNFSADPLFCGAPNGYFELEGCSPCLQGLHPDGYDCGAMVGAFGEGCICGAATLPSTWGTIKAIYR
jgi:hypothetical protein